MSLSFGSLFSGLGGLDLGLERAELTCKWQVEIDLKCSAVLAKHWPDVKRYTDIKEVDFTLVERVDVLCGGFPCQPVSFAGKRLGNEDLRWLWPEFHRAIRVLQPRVVLIENVMGLVSKGLEEVLDGLAEGGYDAEWDCLSAKGCGAPHQRKRLFIVAYPECEGLSGRFFERSLSGVESQAFAKFGNRNISCGSWWLENSSDLCLGDGVPLRLARFAARAYGNAVVPQVAERLGHRIMEVFNIEALEENAA